METDRTLEIPCPSCRVRNRVPFGHGKIEITCGRCGEKYIANSGDKTPVKEKKKSHAVRNILLILPILIGVYIGMKQFSDRNGNVITSVNDLPKQEGVLEDNGNVFANTDTNETSEFYTDDVSENVGSASKIDETIIISSKDAGAFEEQVITTESVFAIKEQALKTAYSSGKIYYEDAVSIMGCNANERQVFEGGIYYIWYVDNSNLAIKVKVDSAGDESITEIESVDMSSIE